MSPSFWLDTPYTPRPPLIGSMDVDVAVLGGGITGVATAHACAQRGFRTVLIEKQTIASGSAGKNAGMVVDGLQIDFIEMIEAFGEQDAHEAWMRTVQAREGVLSLISRYQIDCELTQPGSLYLSQTEEQAAWLRREAEARQGHGIMSTIIEAGTQLRSSPFGAALFNPADCLLHPVKFVRGLAAAAEAQGVQIYEDTPALYFDAHTVRTPQGSVSAKAVVLALESANPYVTPEECELERQQVIVTEPLSPRELEELDWRTGGMLWIAGVSSTGVRLIGSRLFICCAVPFEPTADDLADGERRLISMLHTYFPTLRSAHLRVFQTWNCALLLPTHRHRPFIGERNGCFLAFGHGGNGLTNGTMTGELLAEHLTGAEVPALYRLPGPKES